MPEETVYTLYPVSSRERRNNFRTASSSAITKMRFISLCPLSSLGRNKYVKHCALTRLTLTGDLPAVCLDDALAEGKAQARSPADGFGGKKRIVNIAENFRWDTNPAIDEGD